MPKVKITVGKVEILSEWNESETAKALLEVLPIDSTGEYWGKEFYFDVPVKVPLEPAATDVVEPGTVAYWPEGPSLCVFWGPTPVSRGDECRAYSPVNIVGKVLNPEVLPKLKDRKVRVELLEE